MKLEVSLKIDPFRFRLGLFFIFFTWQLLLKIKINKVKIFEHFFVKRRFFDDQDIHFKISLEHFFINFTRAHFHDQNQSPFIKIKKIKKKPPLKISDNHTQLPITNYSLTFLFGVIYLYVSLL